MIPFDLSKQSIYLAGAVTDPNLELGKTTIWRMQCGESLKAKYNVFDVTNQDNLEMFSGWPKPIQPSKTEKEEAKKLPDSQRKEFSLKRIVLPDVVQAYNSNAILCNLTDPSTGAPMELTYGCLFGKYLVVVAGDVPSFALPFVDKVYSNMNDAVKHFLELQKIPGRHPMIRIEELLAELSERSGSNQSVLMNLVHKYNTPLYPDLPILE